MLEQQQKLILSHYMDIYGIVERSKYGMSFKYFLDMTPEYGGQS